MLLLKEKQVLTEIRSHVSLPPKIEGKQKFSGLKYFKRITLFFFFLWKKNILRKL